MDFGSVWRSGNDPASERMGVRSVKDTVKEKEETLIYTDEAKGYWEILTFSKKMMQKCDRIYKVQEEFEEDGVIYGKCYVVPRGCVMFRRPPK